MLVHAGGYPFVWGYILHGFRLMNVGANQASAAFILVVLQQLFDLACLILLYRTVRKYLGLWTAVLSLYFSGLSITYLAHVSTALPGWFQGDLWILFVVTLVAGLESPPPAKMRLYILSIVLLMLAYLVKFNSLVLVLFFVPVILIEGSRGNIGFALLRSLSVGVLLAAMLYLGYLFGYHYPTTGTYDLHYDAGWLLTARTRPLIALANGINTQRLFALNGALPERYNYEKYYVDMFKHVDAVPARERQRYRGVYQEMLRKNEREVNDFISAHPPWNTSDYSEYVLRVQYYVGLKEGSDLGTLVAYEAVRSHLSEYLTSVVAETVTVTPLNWLPRYLPNLDLLAKSATFVREGRYGYVYYSVPYQSWTQQYRTQSDVSWFWKPGLVLLNTLSVSMAYVVVLIISCGLVMCLYSIVIRKERQVHLFVLVFLCVFIAAFDIASNTISEFRWKELRTVYPFIGVCVGISVGLIGDRVLGTDRLRFFPKRPATHLAATRRGSGSGTM